MERRIRNVGILVANLQLGGAERQAAELAIRLKDYGWEPSLLAMDSRGPLRDLVRDAKTPVIDLGGQFDSATSIRFWFQLLAAIRRIRSVCARREISILHSFLFWENQLAIPASIRHKTIRAVITGRRNTGHFKDGRPHYQLIENLTNPFADAIVANAEAVREDCAARERLSLKKLYVIHNGVDVDRFDRARAKNLRMEYKELANAEFILGAVGNLKRQKRHDRFLEALAEIRKNYPGVKGIIFGRDLGEDTTLRDLRRKLGLKNYLALAGPAEDVAPVLKAMDIFVLSSDYEGMPNVLLEAMACGVPSISTPAGAAPEIIKNRQNGLLTQDFSTESLVHAIKEMINQPERRRSIGRAGQNTARYRFSMEEMARRYAELYEEVLPV